ncbi:MAG: CocE/NonD family hydrolase, partial [Candidatus Helarchaeota archaeon]
TRAYPFSDKEILDGKDIMDWIVSQEWSDGNIFTYGNSYSGVLSELMASLNHPSHKGIVANHCPWDFYLHAVFPGGCFNKAFIELWSVLGKTLDQTKGKNLGIIKKFDKWLGRIAPLAIKSVKPVDSEIKSDYNLDKIANIHRQNKYPIDYFEKVETKDDNVDDEGHTIESISTYSKKEKIEKSRIPIYSWSSWQDSTTADMIIHRFINFSNPQIAIIGDWCHRAKSKANPFYSHKKPAIPKMSDQIKDWAYFYLKCINNKDDIKKVLYYFTMGENKWKSTDTWQFKNQKMEPWYLNNNFSLTKFPPTYESGHDKYKINFDSTTGKRNRWYTLLSLPIKYTKRKYEDKKLLCYTTAPIEQDLEITGYPIVKLFLKSTHSDGMIHVHLEFINNKGKIKWITDGQLRLIFHKISKDKPPYKTIIPYHSYLRKDISPLEPNKITEITFALYPTSILLKKGHRIRIAIGGADKDTFTRYPLKYNPTITIERNKNYQSLILLPIIKNKVL